MTTRLVIEGNMVYEIDEECEKQLGMTGRGRNQNKTGKAQIPDGLAEEKPPYKHVKTVSGMSEENKRERV